MKSQFLVLFHSLGIKKGDRILIASDTIRLWSECRKLKKGFQLNTVLHALMDLVTPEGTLLLPTYNWDFCQGIAFDSKKTKSKSGSLGDIALREEGFSRTRHPVYSFAVWGRDRDYLCSLDNRSAFGPDSPFHYLHEQNATNLVIGVIFNQCFTFAHYVEETRGVPYRYLKPFTGRYIDENGQERTEIYSMYVRNLDMDVVNVPDIDPFIDENLVEKKIERFGTYFKVLHFANAFEAFTNDIITNKGRNFVSYVGQEET